MYQTTDPRRPEKLSRIKAEENYTQAYHIETKGNQ